MLHHVEIYVRDLKKTRDFYDFLLPKLGYSIFQEWEQGFSYKGKEHYLVFVQVEETYSNASYHRKQVGLNHLAFYGGSPQEVDSLREELLKRGATLLYDASYPFAGGPNHYALFLEDPDRVKIEIVSNTV